MARRKKAEPVAAYLSHEAIAAQHERVLARPAPSLEERVQRALSAVPDTVPEQCGQCGHGFERRLWANTDLCGGCLAWAADECERLQDELKEAQDKVDEYETVEVAEQEARAQLTRAEDRIVELLTKVKTVRSEVSEACVRLSDAEYNQRNLDKARAALDEAIAQCDEALA